MADAADNSDDAMSDDAILATSNTKRARRPRTVSTSSMRGGRDVREAIAERNQFLIAELVTAEGQLGPTLRSVYDTDSSTAGTPADFLKSLNEFVAKADARIEQICSSYYEEFIQSVNQLLQVRQKASRLKAMIAGFNEELAEATKPVIAATERLIAMRKVQRNIIATIECMTSTLPIIQLYCKAQAQLNSQRYYPALKSLEELELMYLDRADMNFTFIEKMKERVPLLRAKVKQVAFDDLQAFLTDIRNNAKRIGESAMRYSQASSALEDEIIRDNISFLSLRKSTGSDTASAPPSPSREAMATLDESTANEEDYATEQAEFHLLHRSLHIYEVLGVRPEGERYYKDERKKQAQLVLEPFSTVSSGVSEGYRECFYQVAGFFIVEDTVLCTTTKLLSKQWVDDLWDSAVTEIAKILQAQLDTFNDATVILEIKELIVHFCQTLQGYGYACSRLYDVCIRAKDRYTTALLMQCGARFRDAFLADNYGQIRAENEEDYSTIVESFPYRNAALEETPFPRVLPFSSMVPAIYKQILWFIQTSVDYIENLDLSQTEVDEAARKSTNFLLSKTLSGTMSDVIRSSTLTLQQLTQISVNTSSLQDACKDLEDVISKATHSIGDDLHVSSLYGASAFKDARAAVEEKLLKVLQNKIDEFFGCSEFDWLPDHPYTDADGPSDHIHEMLAYLTTQFASLTQLPAEAAATAYFWTCKYIAKQLLEILKDPQALPRFNTEGMRKFKVDVKLCIEYAQTCPFGTLTAEAYIAPFERLTAINRLILDWDWERYLSPTGGGPQLYSGISARLALSLLERYEHTSTVAPGDKKGKKKEERRSRSETASLSRRLREMVASQERLSPAASPATRPSSTIRPTSVSNRTSTSPAETPAAGAAAGPQRRRSLPSPPPNEASARPSAAPPPQQPQPSPAPNPPAKKSSRLRSFRSSKQPAQNKK